MELRGLRKTSSSACGRSRLRKGSRQRRNRGLQTSSEQHSGIVLIVEIVRPIANGVRNDLHDFIKRPVGISGQQLNQSLVAELNALRVLGFCNAVGEGG